MEELHQQAQLNLQSLLQGKDGEKIKQTPTPPKKKKGVNGGVDGWRDGAEGVGEVFGWEGALAESVYMPRTA